MRPPNQYIDFWQGRYERCETPWDLNGPAPFLAHWLETRGAGFPTGTMAVPGCGRGHDAALFARAGFAVTGFDYAPGAIAEAGRLYGESARWVQADWFFMDKAYDGAFDYILEHTCFCAINPKRRADYRETARRLLKPGGRLIGIFWDIDDPDGPPFGSTPGEIRACFEGAFTVESLGPVPEPLRRRENGREYFGVIRRSI